MPSPYIRRRRLAAELRRIREDRDLTADELARLAYQSRTKITRLENGQLRPDLAELMNILDALGVTVTSTRRSSAWDATPPRRAGGTPFGDSMGPRQKLYADLESGAETIRSYNQTGFPALIQIPELISALVDLDECQGPLEYRPERMADARAQRQRRLLQPDGPTYDAVLDESMIHRLAVPPRVKAAQLHDMVELVAAEQRSTFWVLPSNRPIPGGLLPQTSFSLYTFPDPPDPPLAVVDTVTTDLVLSKLSALERYTGMYDRLRDAALSPEDSLAFLRRVADRLAEGAGSEA